MSDTPFMEFVRDPSFDTLADHMLYPWEWALYSEAYLKDDGKDVEEVKDEEDVKAENNETAEVKKELTAVKIEEEED